MSNRSIEPVGEAAPWACYWMKYEQSGSARDMMTWLKHRAFVRLMGDCQHHPDIPQI